MREDMENMERDMEQKLLSALQANQKEVSFK
jgi:hypothetical protein